MNRGRDDESENCRYGSGSAAQSVRRTSKLTTYPTRPAALGVLYLPVPVVDIYVKAGLARLQTTANATFTLTALYATCVIQGGPNSQFSKSYDESGRRCGSADLVRLAGFAWGVRAL
jgi:hypothetical protein